jgi:ATP-dependent DNA ligase
VSSRGRTRVPLEPPPSAVMPTWKWRPFTLDGEAVVVGHDGVAVFDALHRRHKASEALLYAFDLLEHDGRTCSPGHSVTARRGRRGY